LDHRDPATTAHLIVEKLVRPSRRREEGHDQLGVLGNLDAALQKHASV
jgi:hypothetical protein